MKERKKELYCFLSLTLFFLLLISFFYWKFQNDLLIQFLMLTPGLSGLLTRLCCRKKLDGWMLKPRFKGNFSRYFSMYLGLPILTMLGAIVYFLCFPQNFFPEESSYFISFGVSSLSSYYENLWIQAPLAILLNPLFGLFSCLGEEYGWRGTLFPLLSERYGTKIGVLFSSFIWGIWHTPMLILIGLNYGFETPFLLRLGMQILLCIVLGIIFSYFFIRSCSIWLPVLGHAAINGLDKVKPSSLFMPTSLSYNPTIGPDQASLVSILFLSFLAIYCFYHLPKNQEKRFSLS